MYGAVVVVCRRMTLQMLKLCYRNVLQHAAQIELFCGMLHPSTYDDAMCVIVLDYNIAVRQCTAPGA